MLNVEFSESYLGDRDENLDRHGHIKGECWSLSYLLDGYEPHTPHYVDILSESIHEKCTIDLNEDMVIKSLEDALSLPNNIKGKASAVFVLCSHNQMHIMTAGDTRAYLLQSKTRTTDHSQFQFLLDKGMISGHQANNHPLRKYLRKSLNSSSSLDSLEARTLDNVEDVLLCSDGFWSNFEESEIFTTNTAEESKSKFEISKTKRPGESDNQTLLLLKHKS